MASAIASRQGRFALNVSNLPLRTRAPGLKRLVAVHVVAFKDSDKSVTDWRVQQMVSVSRKYYNQLWSKGNHAIAPEILDEHIVYKDMATNPVNVSVGTSSVQSLVQSFREIYPDLWFDVEQIGYCDSSHLFVQWSAEATNLGSHHGHKPTQHHSKWSGVDLVGFNSDRTKIAEVTVHRQLTNEERVELQGVARSHDVVSFEDRYELRLPRLHWEPNELRLPE